MISIDGRWRDLCGGMALAMLLMWPIRVFAQAPTPIEQAPVDATGFNISGVARNMSVFQVESLLSNFSNSGFPSVEHQPSQLRQSSTFVKKMSSKKDIYQLDVVFGERVPPGSGGEEEVIAVSMTTYKPSQVEAQQLFDADIQKYGKPTLQYTANAASGAAPSFWWCQRVEKRWDGLKLCDSPRLYLTWNNYVFYLTLEDPNYAVRLQQYVNSVQMNLNRGKPPL